MKTSKPLAKPPLRVAIVAHGRRKIPTKGWGAVENIIWQYATRLQARGQMAIIVNVKWRLATYLVARMRMRRRIDVCHVHNDKALLWMVPMARRLNLPLVSTSHYFFDPSRLTAEAEETLKWLCLADRHIVLNEDVRDLILARRPDAKIRVLRNGTEVKAFRFGETGNGKAIVVGKLQARKRQRLTAQLLSDAGIECHFVGPAGDEDLAPEHQNLHLGEWTREQLRDRLTDYSVVVLYSEAEGQALVVVEGLAAGLSVVVSPNASQNLDVSKPFIHVASSEEELVAATRAALESAARYRAAAREYAEKMFDFDQLVVEYEQHLRDLMR